METFVVRVWTPADKKSMGAVLRGVVRHVTTGTERPFRCDAEVLSFLRRATGRDGELPPMLSEVVQEAAGVEPPPDTS